MKRIFLIVVMLVLAIPIVGCGAKKMATDVIGKIATEGMVSIEDEVDVEFARESSPALIKTLEVLRYGDRKNRDALVLLSKAYGQFAFGFLEEDMLRYKKGGDEYNAAKTRAELFYRRGKEYGIAALIDNSGMKKAFKSPFPEFQKALKSVGKGYVPALFWTAFSWANWLNMNTDDPAAIVDLPRIEAIIKRIIELDGSFYYGSAHSLVGTIAASRPKMLGGNLELSDSEYKEAMKIAPDYLMTRVLYAQYYARQAQDMGLFEKTLNDVIETDTSKASGGSLANEMAKRRAKLLIEIKKGLF